MEYRKNIIIQRETSSRHRTENDNLNLIKMRNAVSQKK